MNKKGLTVCVLLCVWRVQVCQACFSPQLINTFSLVLMF